MKPQAAAKPVDSRPEEGGLSAEENRRLMRLLMESLRPFAEARMAVVRALRADLGKLEILE